ncbi:GCN5 family acetyltransferase [Paenibacillus sp. Soil766]|uniref:GNAT family N-acetyltransferase n=1 Tax=Paenibacillus sp. Soil766 TaxID=1736404 RepID=UPI00070D1114|nr:GNAT family N-acetyltransferase [Paenibacillus sp. Soil766]KRE83244.1 GCN5 family acetyltransferase [Paenibacillus sp. Soil766]
MITKKCLINEIQYLIDEYIESLSSPFDSFLEEHILASTFYKIQEGFIIVGYFAIHNNDLLTQFYISRAYQMSSQRMFSQVLDSYSVNSLFVPTCDELFISLAVDKDFTINKQAYFFQDNLAGIVESNLSNDESFRAANLEDLIQIQQTCGDFLDQYERRIANGELFTYYRDSVMLGIGIVEKSNMIKGLASIGMFTNEAYRKQGIGRFIIIQLRKWCKEQGVMPVSGCWYYNEASKRTLESAGMVTKTRLLNIQVN